MKIRLYILSFFLPCFLLESKAETIDTISHNLKNVEVVGRTYTSPLKRTGTAGTLSLDMEWMNTMPHILGNADPMHYTQLLPQVQTCSEYDCGLHIQGCDNQHNVISLGGVPLYNVEHLLGFFSVFNSSHYQQMNFSPDITDISSGSRLGGMVDMQLPDKVNDHINGELNVGPLSSQGTIRIPTSKSSQLILSARAAYLNLLYGRWLKMDDEAVNYSYSDYNLTWLLNLDSSNRIWVDAYYGIDNAKLSDDNYSASVKMKWSNNEESVHWLHTFSRSELLQTVYHTQYNCKLDVDQTSFKMKMPSSVSDFAYKGDLTFTSGLKTSWEAIAHHIQPQQPDVDTGSSRTEALEQVQDCQEYSLGVSYGRNLDERISLQANVKGHLYNSPESSLYYGASPHVQMAYNAKSAGTFTIGYGWNHQYLVQTGFSSLGLPSEFWFAAGKYSKPQYSQSVNLSHNITLFDGLIDVSSEVYFKRLYNQVEYGGNLLDFATTRYELQNELLYGKGVNYGFDIQINKRTGKLQGWLSYSFSRSLRKFDSPDYVGWFPSNHERLHELNLVATYKFNSHWDAGATFTIASGTPYTPAEYMYYFDGHIIAQYGEHNSKRLSPYRRLDLSVNYSFRSNRHFDHGLNLSLYNALFFKNRIYYCVKLYKNTFRYAPMSFIVDALPSINYYIRFK